MELTDKHILNPKVMLGKVTAQHNTTHTHTAAQRTKDTLLITNRSRDKTKVTGHETKQRARVPMNVEDHA